MQKDSQRMKVHNQALQEEKGEEEEEEEEEEAMHAFIQYCFALFLSINPPTFFLMHTQNSPSHSPTHPPFSSTYTTLDLPGTPNHSLESIGAGAGLGKPSLH